MSSVKANTTSASMAEKRTEKSVDFKLVDDSQIKGEAQEKDAPPAAKGKADFEELKARMDQSESRGNVEQKTDEITDADLEVEGLGKFYDRITLDSFQDGRRQHGKQQYSESQPKSILKNKPYGQQSQSFQGGYRDNRFKRNRPYPNFNERRQYGGGYEPDYYHDGRYYQEPQRRDYYQGSRQSQQYQFVGSDQGMSNPGAHAYAQQYHHIDRQQQLQNHRLILQYYPPQPQYWHHAPPPHRYPPAGVPYQVPHYNNAYATGQGFQGPRYPTVYR